MLGDYPMALPGHLNSAILDYEVFHGPMPMGVHKFARPMGKTEMLASDLEAAAKTGEPIQDWSIYVSSPPEKQA